MFEGILADIEMNFRPDTPPGGAVVACETAQGVPQKLRQIAEDLNRRVADEEREANRVADAKKLQTGASLTRRETAKAVVEALRNPRGTTPVYLHEADVAENQWAFGAAKKILRNFGPDTLLGIERGGRLMTETAAFGLEGAAARLLVIPKEDPDEEGRKTQLDKSEDYIIKKLMERARRGQRKFAVVETWFGGGNARFLTGAMNGFIQAAAAEGLNVAVAMVFFREKIGFEHAGIDDGIIARPARRELLSIVIPVRFLAGEDVRAIAESDKATNPLVIFNDRGETRTLLDSRGTPTRVQFQRLMNPTP